MARGEKQGFTDKLKRKASNIVEDIKGGDKNKQQGRSKKSMSGNGQSLARQRGNGERLGAQRTGRGTSGGVRSSSQRNLNRGGSNISRPSQQRSSSTSQRRSASGRQSSSSRQSRGRGNA